MVCTRAVVGKLSQQNSKPQFESRSLPTTTLDCLKINENKVRRKEKDLFKLAISKESATITSILTDSKACRGVDAGGREERESFRSVLIGGRWQGEARSRASYVIAAYLAFSA